MVWNIPLVSSGKLSWPCSHLIVHLFTGRAWENEKSLIWGKHYLNISVLVINFIFVLNPKDSTATATKKKINSISARTRTGSNLPDEELLCQLYTHSTSTLSLTLKYLPFTWFRNLQSYYLWQDHVHSSSKNKSHFWVTFPNIIGHWLTVLSTKSNIKPIFWTTFRNWLENRTSPIY